MIFRGICINISYLVDHDYLIVFYCLTMGEMSLFDDCFIGELWWLWLISSTFSLFIFFISLIFVFFLNFRSFSINVRITFRHDLSVGFWNAQISLMFKLRKDRRIKFLLLLKLGIKVCRIITERYRHLILYKRWLKWYVGWLPRDTHLFKPLLIYSMIDF
jgi:hypothetical protein